MPFRVLKYTGQWIKDSVDAEAKELTYRKAEAQVFEDSDREYWQTQRDFEIIPLAEDEVMARMGHPRLPGF